MSDDAQSVGPSHQVLVNTVYGEEISLEVPQSSRVSDVKKLVCEHFKLQAARVHLAQGHELLTDSQTLADAVGGSSSKLTLVIESMIKVRRRVWMVPTLGYKGSGKGLQDGFLKDDTVLLDPDWPVGEQLSRILAFDPQDVDKESPPGPSQKGGSKGKGKGKSFNVDSTVCFLVPFGRLPETQSRSVLSDPPRPDINQEDVKVGDCLQSASEAFGDGTREIVVLTPSYWWCPSRASEGPRNLLTQGDLPPEIPPSGKGLKGKAPPAPTPGKGKMQELRQPLGLQRQGKRVESNMTLHICSPIEIHDG